MMNSSLKVMVGLLTLLPFTQLAQPVAGWRLVWSDEFAQPDNSGPRPEYWTQDVGGGGWGNNELQTYTTGTNNCRIEGGKLVIEAKKETVTGPDNITREYTSARLKTKGKRSWTYGRIEARLQVPSGKGIWPAFWMLGADFDSAGWPACGEIDIMEHIGREPGNVYGTVHGPGYSGAGGIGKSFSFPQGTNAADSFHIFAVEWTTNRIQWFVDGHQFFSITPDSLPSGSKWVFDKPQFLLLNLAVGGNWPGNPDGSTSFPQRYVIDYIRVYERANASQCGGSALQNGGFENETLAGWTRFGPNVVATPTPLAPLHGGSNAVKVFGQFTGTENFSGLIQEHPSHEGLRYSAEAWATTLSSDQISGNNQAWLEVSFRDYKGLVLKLFRSQVMDKSSATSTWLKLAATNEFHPISQDFLGTSTSLLAPPNTSSVRTQLTFRQRENAGGSVFFDDLCLQTTNIPIPPVIDTEIPGGELPFGWSPGGLTFRTTSTCPGLEATNVQVSLNGAEVSDELRIFGDATSSRVGFAGLTSNVFYKVQVQARDGAGREGSASWEFDTFRQDNFMWEAEDYDFDGGQFLVQPVPSGISRTNSYFGRVAVENIDRHETSGDGPKLYRAGDPVSTQVAEDFWRRAFDAAKAGGDTTVKDYKVSYFNPGEWLNYTREFPAGEYYVYGRLAGGLGASELHLDRVLDGHGTKNQKTERVGTFRFVGRGWQTYHFVPLTNAGGDLAVLRLAGKTTLRITSTGGCDPNFFMLVPIKTVPVTAILEEDGLRLGFATTAGVDYRVLYKPEVHWPDWMQLHQGSGTGTTLSMREDRLQGSRFYRIVSP